MVSPDDPLGDIAGDPGARPGRGRTWAIVLTMTLLAALGAPLAAFIMGGPDPATSTPLPGSPVPESPAGVPAQPGESMEPEVSGPVSKPDFVLASLNVLGHSHTTETGKEPELDSGPRRLRRAVRLLDEANAEVVGLQELQRPQAKAFESLVGDDWGLFHAADDTENAVAWQRDTWTKVRARTVAVPYFNGNEREMPVVLLRHKPTGAMVWFVNVHNPANTERFPEQAGFRDEATAIEMELIERLARGKNPIVLIGDLNLRAEAFCYFTKSGTLVSATGEAREKPCQDPAYDGIDWIFGSPDLAFEDWHVRDDEVVDMTTDHPLVTVGVRLPR